MATTPSRADNKVRVEDRVAHDWYRFVLSFPPHLVREYIQRFGLDSESHVLDPFCGTGTTLVECKKLGIPSVGVEANPMACFASRVKVDWSPSPIDFQTHTRSVAEEAASALESDGIEDHGRLPLFRKARNPRIDLLTLAESSEKLLLKGSISPLPLHKTLVLLDAIEQHKDMRFYGHDRLALAKALVCEIGNLHFGPEVGIAPPKGDAAVISCWLKEVQAMAEDLQELQAVRDVRASVHLGDARSLTHVIKPNLVDAVITSPPYPNEKDYTRTTRLESVLLGFVRNKQDLRALKQGLVRSNTRGVFKNDRDEEFIAGNKEIEEVAAAIENRRVELGKTSGFERLYSRVTKLYFGGMARHLSGLRAILRPGARLAYVVGDQASYLRVMIRTGAILAGIAERLGYEVIGIDLFRTRWATATREQLREEVLVLRWPGKPPCPKDPA